MSRLGLECDDRLVDQLLRLLRLLERWSATYNLTSVSGLEAMIGVHLLDSLSALPYVVGERVIDVGTGAGFPGLPLALAAPGKQFVLLDSNAKKTRFVQQAVIDLGVTNVSVVRARAELFCPDYRFDTVLLRAVSTLADAVAWSGHLFAPGGRLLAWKGRFPSEEIALLAADGGRWAQRGCRVVPLNIPGVDGERHLVCWSLDVGAA